MADRILLTGDVLQQKWNAFADLVGIPKDERLNLSNGWLGRFKDGNGLKEARQHGEAASANANTVENERKMAPDRGISDSKQSGVKGNKIRITYAFTLNADGSEKLPPFIIGKAAQWIWQWDCELSEKRCNILLLQDNFSGHIVPDDLQNICVENFEPNLTVHIQPKDQGIIRCFKAHYQARFIQRAVDCYDEGITPSKIYNINQLQALCLADLAWCDVDTTTIWNCWRKAGILPEMDLSSSNTNQPSIPISSLLHNSSHQMDPVAHAERDIEATLDDLVETSDQEIYEVVMEAIEAHENMEINGSDDVDDEILSEPRPTHCDVLKAASTIHKYVEDLNDPIAHKMESILGSFNTKLHLEQTENMKSTTLTDFFRKV
ncbi:hypothetical protein BYT27DRAFT_7226676 [Phlegmacium glaucopus]|nr:hypothetical protein BYT27DRAFT_7226676 [Phlegmacium glaucopus]